LKIMSSLLLVLSLATINVNCHKKQAGTDNSGDVLSSPITIISQEQIERKFYEFKLDTIASINFEELTEPIYRPMFCELNEKGDVYVFDGDDYIIHKFIINKAGYKHLSFGRGSGQGPGELSPVFTDFKLFNNLLYIAQPNAMSIVVYSDKGEYVRTISLRSNKHNNIAPEKLTIQSDNCIVIVPRGLRQDGKLFITVDSLGNTTGSFGRYLNGTPTGGYLMHECNLGGHFADSTFYYCSVNFELCGLYSHQNLKMVKAGIDGEQKPEYVEKQAVEGEYVTVTRKVRGRQLIVLDCLMGVDNEFVFLKVYYLKEKKMYYDVYTKNDFNYICSIKNFPKNVHFKFKGNRLYCVDDYTLKVYETNIDQVIPSQKSE